MYSQLASPSPSPRVSEVAAETPPPSQVAPPTITATAVHPDSLSNEDDEIFVDVEYVDEPLTPSTSTFRGARDSTTLNRARVGGTRWGGTGAAHRAAQQAAALESAAAEEGVSSDPATAALLASLKLQEEQAIEALKLRAQQEMEDAELAHRLAAGDRLAPPPPNPRLAAPSGTAAAPKKQGFFSRVFGRKEKAAGGGGARASSSTEQLRITVEVPPGLAPGQRFAVNVRNKGRVVLTVPAGARPGEAVEFVVKVPSSGPRARLTAPTAAAGRLTGRVPSSVATTPGAPAPPPRLAAAPRPEFSVTPPKLEDITAMKSLGFDEAFCVRALMQTGGSVEVAMDWLLRNLPVLEAEAALLKGRGSGGSGEAAAPVVASTIAPQPAQRVNAEAGFAEVVTMDSPRRDGGGGVSQPSYEELLRQQQQRGTPATVARQRYKDALAEVIVTASLIDLSEEGAEGSGGAAAPGPPAYSHGAPAPAPPTYEPSIAAASIIVPQAATPVVATTVAAAAAAGAGVPAAADAVVAAPAPPAPPAADPLAALKTAKAMLDAGLISTEEYEETKKGILESLKAGN